MRATWAGNTASGWSGRAMVRELNSKSTANSTDKNLMGRASERQNLQQPANDDVGLTGNFRYRALAFNFGFQIGDGRRSNGIIRGDVSGPDNPADYYRLSIVANLNIASSLNDQHAVRQNFDYLRGKIHRKRGTECRLAFAGEIGGGISGKKILQAVFCRPRAKKPRHRGGGWAFPPPAHFSGRLPRKNGWYNESRPVPRE